MVSFTKENLTFTGTDTPMAQLMLTVMAAVAQFERQMLLERQKEGVALAKRAGKYLDARPPSARTTANSPNWPSCTPRAQPWQR